MSQRPRQSRLPLAPGPGGHRDRAGQDPGHDTAMHCDWPGQLLIAGARAKLALDSSHPAIRGRGVHNTMGRDFGSCF